MLLHYKTVMQHAQGEIVEKKSRFIATAKPVESEEEAHAFVEELRKKYWDASHNVFAYRISPQNPKERASDDGEPAGTAGPPVLEILRKEDIVNAVVVVTRYFGGTLLGAGGLIRAYGAACKAGVSAASVGEMVLFQPVCVTVDYSLSGKVQYEALQNGFLIRNTSYTETVTFEILVRPPQLGKLETVLMDITAGTANPLLLPTLWLPLDNFS